MANAAHTITAFPTLNFCTTTYPTTYQNTVLFTLDEGVATDFNPSQASKTLIVTLPAGFEFNTVAGPTVTRTGNQLTINSFTWTTTAITVTLSTTSNTAQLNAIQFNNFQVRAIAAGSGDLVRTGGTFTVEGSVNLPGPAESFGHLFAGPPTTYVSSSVVQYTTANITKNCTSTSNPILEIRIDVIGNSDCPATITQFNFSTLGDVGYSQNPLTNITRADVYYTGLIPGFSYTHFFGSVNNPNGAFTINGSQSLSLGSGTYYFYLSYDVPLTANVGDGLDASMISFLFNAGTINNMSTPNPAGIRTIVTGTCAPAPDLPNPPANIQTVTAGSLVIPMDNAHQNLWLSYPFNIKSYGLVNALLMNDIPVKWVIRSGKIKDAIDFSAVAARIYPTAVAAANQDFRAGEFIIDTTWLNHPFYSGGQTALQVISAFAVQWKVAVYQLSTNVSVDVRYTLNQRPKIACFNNGGNANLHTTILDSAKVTNYVAINTGLFTGLAQCYTFCSEAHWAGTVADTGITASVRTFVNEGGNFLAECKGVDTYENNQGPYHFESTNGVTIVNNSITNAYYNPDLAYQQFEGTVIANPGGSEVNWVLNGGSWVPNFYYAISSSTNIDNVFTGGAHLTSPDSVGSNVFYLGGHTYATNWSTLTYINAQRMYLNAALIPAHRPTAFTLNPGNNTTICQGQSVTLGGSPTGPPGATYNWSPSSSLNNSTSANPIATPTVTTTYTVVADNGGCPGGPSYVTITVNPTPVAPTASSNSPICAGSSLNLTASNIVGATYSWTGPNSFSSGSQNPTITNATVAAAGTYSVTVTVGGCTGPAGTTIVTITPAPVAPTASSNSPICEGSTLNLSASNIAGATYSWVGPNLFSSSSQNPNIVNATVAASGTYSVTATVGGCTGPAGITSVTVNPTPAAPTASSNSPLCSGTTLNLTASNIAGATYSWTGPNGFSSSSQNPSIVNATTAASGTYSVTATVGGCTGPAGTVSVIVSPPPATPTASSNSPICAGSTLNLTASSIAGATYSWTGPNSFSSSSQNPNIVNATVAASGTYSVTATVAGCTGSAGTVVVTVNPIPVAPTASSNSPLCSGTTLNLTASNIAGATYSWTGPNSFSSGSQNPSIINATVAASGTYSVTATVGGCTGPAGTVVVTVNPTPAAPTASSNSPICAGSTLNLTASNIAGATYSWTGPNSFSSASQNPNIVNATVAASGTYSVTATVGGCTGTAGTVVVTVNPIPAAPTASSNSPICAGSTLNLTASNIAGATYSWTGPNSFSSASQNPNIINATVAASGNYSVTATVAGCTGSAGTVVVTINPIPSAPTASSNSPLCSGTTLNLTASNIAGATYSWTGPNSFSSSSQNPNIVNATVAASGTYSVTVTVLGCTSSSAATTNVTVNPIPSPPTASSNSSICAGSTLNLTASNIAGATYSWTGPNSFSSASQNPNIVNATVAASGTYSVSITVSGCTSSDATTNVIVNPIPAPPTASSNSPVCSGNALNLFATTIAGATYLWTGPNGFSSSSQNPTISNVTLLANGTYSVTVTVAGCSSSSAATTTVTINATPAPPTASSNSPLCVGSTLNLSASNVAGATYSWTGPSSFSSSTQNNTIANVTLANGGTYTVTVTVNGCTSNNATTNVVIHPIPNPPVASSNSPVCTGNTLNLTANNIAGATYSWTGPNSFSSGVQNPNITNITLAGAGTYSVTVTVLGCTSSSAATITVIVNPTPAPPVASSNSPLCSGTTLNLSASTIAGATYSWTGPNGFSSSLQNPNLLNVTLADTGTYSVTVTVNGCSSSSATTNVIINPIPTAPSASSNSPICTTNTLNLFATNVIGATYSWNGPNGFSSALQNPSITNATTAATGTYSVTVTVNGCTSVDSITVATVNSTPVTPVASSNSPLCSGTTLQLSVDTIPGATYSWSGPNGFSSALQNPTISNITLAGAGTYTVTANNGCSSVPTTISVVINPTPNPPVASSNSPLCQGSTLNLNSTLVAGATYSWSGPGGFTSSTQNNSIPNVTSANAGTYSVTVNVNGCTSNAATVNVVINIPAIVNAGTDQTVCANNAAVILAGSSTTGSGVWTTSGSGTFTPSNSALNGTYNPSNADTAAGTITLTLTSTGNGACSSVNDQMIVTITNAPTSNAGADQTVCANNDVVTLNGSVTVASGGTWTSSGTGIFSPSNSALNATYTPSSADTSAGTVTLYLNTTGNGQCISVIDSMVITITNAPFVNAGNNISVCKNNPNATITGTSNTGSGTWTSSGSGIFSPNTNTLNVTYIPSTADTTAGFVTIYLTSTGNGNCFADQDTITIIYSAPPSVYAGEDVVVCGNNGAYLLFQATSSTGFGIWTTSGSGTFSPNDSTINATYIPSAADTAAGSVTLTLTSTHNGGCLAVSDQIVITYSDAPVADAGPNQIVCSNNSVVVLNGSFTIATGGVWSTMGSGTFSPSTTDMNATYQPSAADTAAGVVQIILTTTGNGICLSVTDTMIITISTAPNVNAGANIISCISSPNTPLNGNSATGSGTWTTLGSGIFSPNANILNPTYVPSNADTTAGSVTLILTSTNNGLCNPVNDTVVVFFQPVPIVSVSSDQTVCANNDLVSVSGNSSTGSGTWTTNGSGIFSPSVAVSNPAYTPSATDTSAGNIVLTYTATNGCSPIASSLTITITPAPYVLAGADISTCANNPNANLSGYVGGATNTGQWSTSNGTGIFSPSNANLNTTYVPSAADTIAGSVTLILTSTGNGNCLAVNDTIILTITHQPFADAGNDITACANNAAQLSGTITGGSGTGIWSTLNGTGIFSPSNSNLNATYTPSNADTLTGVVILILTSTGNGGCFASSDTVLITVNPGPVVFAGTDQSVCSNNPDVILNGSVTVASGGIWTTAGNGTFNPNNTTFNATYIPDTSEINNGSVILILTSTGNGLCQSVSDSMTIIFTPSPLVSAGNSQIICSGTMNVNLSGNISGGATSGIWATTGSGTFTPNDSTLNATYNLSSADTTTGNVLLILTSTNNGNCNSSADTITISITPIPFAIAGNDTAVCANTAGIVLNGQVQGGSGTGYWTTSGSGIFAPDSSLLNATYIPSSADTANGSVTLILAATNACLPSSDTVVLTFAPAPMVASGPDVLICAGDLVALNGSVSNSTGMLWTTNGDGTFTPTNSIVNPVYTPGPLDTANGTVTILFTSSGNAFCNPVADSMVITINSKPNALFASGPACVNTPVGFTDQSTNTNGNIVSWNWTSGTDTSTQQNPNFTFTSTGIQTVTLVVATAAGCSDTITRTLFVNPAPQANYTSVITCPTDVALTDSSLIFSGTIVSWSWNFGDSSAVSTLQSPNYIYADTGIYIVTLTVMSDSGCVSAASDTLTFVPCVNGETNPPVVPSAFTPNGDGHNDILYVKGGPFKTLDFRIYNEWGNLIFHSESQSIGWDGTYKGKVQPEGTYVWTVSCTTLDGVDYKISGDVTLIR
ncbi:MAG: PKD domain-containing protein [Bacteroidetes bacterium]|nr:PKD domain-containing protein [Bacteroidota bacterium]